MTITGKMISYAPTPAQRFLTRHTCLCIDEFSQQRILVNCIQVVTPFYLKGSRSSQLKLQEVLWWLIKRFTLTIFHLSLSLLELSMASSSKPKRHAQSFSNHAAKPKLANDRSLSMRSANSGRIFEGSVLSLTWSSRANVILADWRSSSIHTSAR